MVLVIVLLTEELAFLDGMLHPARQALSADAAGEALRVDARGLPIDTDGHVLSGESLVTLSALGIKEFRMVWRAVWRTVLGSERFSDEWSGAEEALKMLLVPLAVEGRQDGTCGKDKER